MSADFELRRQTEAAKDLLANLRAAGQIEDDAELVADTVEGETGLIEAITAALAEIDECDIVEKGCQAKIAEITARQSAAASRRDRVRAAIEQAMIAVDLPKLKLPIATLTVAKRAAQPVIDNEAEIPSRFFRQPDPPAPKLDKKALATALADGPVAGAHLDNGSVTLTIRRK